MIFGRQVNAAAIGAAMGDKGGNFLRITNIWGSVFIERLASGRFEVTGDIADIRKRSRVFTSKTQAMVYALESLSEQRNGSPNK